MSQAEGMRIIQSGSTGVVLMLEKQIKYLLSDVVSIGGHFFFFYRQVYNSIFLPLDHAKCFISLVSTQLSILTTTSVESIFQTCLCLEVL